MIISLQARNNLTIPQELRRSLDLKPGDPLQARIEQGSLVLTPVSVIPRTLKLTPSGQAKEQEADDDITNGRVDFFDSTEALIDDLQSDS